MEMHTENKISKKYLIMMEKGWEILEKKNKKNRSWEESQNSLCVMRNHVSNHK